jgi:hypothetical protein
VLLRLVIESCSEDIGCIDTLKGRLHRCTEVSIENTEGCTQDIIVSVTEVSIDCVLKTVVTVLRRLRVG